MSSAEQPFSRTGDATSLRALDTMRAGDRLKAAREAAGLSLDQVAQQLKLAPRQVKALEDESFDQLPGRTFSRGFVRNYARLLNLEADELLAQLPETVQAPLQASSLRSTATIMAELPTVQPARAGVARWLIPLVLIACIVGAVGYEWYRGGFVSLREPQRVATGEPRKVAAVAVSTLPNPLANSGAALTPAQPAAPDTTQANAANVVASGRESPESATATPGDAPLVVTYAGPSWTEIRDRDGQLLVSRLVTADSVESVRGTAPFDLTLGNAHMVRVVYLGKAIDLAPYTRHSVARLILP
ncbi:MAG: helix-turn-helix domain-containing protein [Betaproteobacteria bacterium]|nr:MAG: helix-turn-helix domain-containing protein [Betaproteobacteria bacterium]